MPLPKIQGAHLVNDRSLSGDIRLFNGAVVFSFMLHPTAGFIHRHLMVHVPNEDSPHNFETVPVF